MNGCGPRSHIDNETHVTMLAVHKRAFLILASNNGRYIVRTCAQYYIALSMLYIIIIIIIYLYTCTIYRPLLLRIADNNS